MNKRNHFKSGFLRVALMLILAVMTFPIKAWADEVKYIDEDGVEKTADAIVLTGTETELGQQAEHDSDPLIEKWYVCTTPASNNEGKGLYYNSGLIIKGHVRLILADGCKMTVENNNNAAIRGGDNPNFKSMLSIYDQSNDMMTRGAIAVKGGTGIDFENGNFIVNGGIVNVIAQTDDGTNVRGHVIINGGQVSVNGGSNRYGIYAWGDIILGWRNTTDYIQASSYYTYNYKNKYAIKTAEGKVFVYEGGTLSGGTTLNDGQIGAIAGKRLTPDLWGITSGNDGSETKPYTITNTAGLDLLAKMVNGTDGYAANDFSGKHFVLGNDISYTHKQAGETGADTENNFTAIGGCNSNFKGTFDGQGHTVSGIRIYKGGSEKGDKLQGLFGNINGGTVCHVTLDDAQITGYEDTGGIVGYNNGGNITDCHVTENVCISAQQSTSSHGGIVGDNGGSVNGCTSKAKIKTNSSSCDYFGGIAGCNGPQGTMKDCLYLGSEVEGNSCVGAVAGENKGSIINCYYTDYFSGKGADGSPISNNAIGSNYGTATNTGLAKTITLGEGVTLNGTAADYGPASPNTSDVRITSYATAADQPGFALKLETVSGTTTTTAYYSTSGATVALGYSGIVPTGSFVDYVVTAAGSNVAVSEANTFVIPDYKVTVSTKLYMKNVPYMTWDDTKKKLVDATTPDDTKVYLLTGGGATTLPGGWYVVMNTNTDAAVNEGIDAHYTGTLTFNGDANIILGDGANMTLRRELFYLITEGIIVNEGSLAIYAQSTGKNQGGLFAFCDLSKTAINVVSANTDANITINGGDIGIIVVEGDCISANSTGGNACVTINGGSTIVNGGSYGYGISARSDAIRSVTINDGIIEIKGGDADILVSGNTVTSGPSTLTINGGSVSASGNNGFIVASSDSKGKITLGWKNSTTDFIRADKYTVDGVVTIAANKRFFVYGTQAVIGDDTAEATITDLTTIEEQNLIPVIPLPTIGGQYMLLYEDEAYYKVVTNEVVYVVSGYDLSGTPAVGITEVTGGGVPKGFPIIIGVESGTLPSSIGLVLADAEATTIDGNTKAANPLKNLIVCDGSSSVGALLAAALGGTADLSEYVLFTFVNGSFRPVIATAESKPTKGTCLLAIPKMELLNRAQGGSDNTSGARTLSIELGGDATGIRPTPGPSLYGGEWYDLQGRRLSGRPTAKGVYIHNGHAVVVQ